MPVPVETVRSQAHAALKARQNLRALQLFLAIRQAAPHDWEARIGIADALVALKQAELAMKVYVAAGVFAARTGHPLSAIVAGHAAGELGGPASDVLDLVVDLYSSSSPSVATRGVRVSAPLGISVDDDLLPPPADAPNVVDGQELLERAARLSGMADGVRFPDRLQAIPLLSSLPRQGMAVLLQNLQVRRLRDGDFVIREGDPGTSLFFCALGRLVVQRTRADETPPRTQELGRLSEGAIFGEMALLTGQPRTASVRVEGQADVLELGRASLEKIAQAVPDVGEALERYRRERLLQNLLQMSPLFRGFAPEQRIELLQHFEGVEAEKGEVLIRQGEEGRGLFVMLDGECEVTRADGDLDVSVAHLGAGEVFGEISLLHELPATATVTVSRHATLLVLSADYFRRLVENVPEVRSYIAGLAGQRLRNTGNLLGDEVLLQVANGLLLE